MQTMCENPDLAAAQKAYVCFLPRALTHVTNAGAAIYSLEAVATQNSDVFKVHQRSFCRSATFSDQGDDPGDLKI